MVALTLNCTTHLVLWLVEALADEAAPRNGARVPQCARWLGIEGIEPSQFKEPTDFLLTATHVAVLAKRPCKTDSIFTLGLATEMGLSQPSLAPREALEPSHPLG